MTLQATKLQPSILRYQDPPLGKLEISRRISIPKAVIFLMLFTYAVMVVYPMFWLFYTSVKSDQDIFLRPFSLPSPLHLHWNNFSRAWVDGHFGEYFFNSV